jgi:hypothetical protein
MDYQDDLNQIQKVYSELRNKYNSLNQYIHFRSIKKTFADEKFNYHGDYWEIISEYISYVVNIRVDLILAKSFKSICWAR